MTKTRAFIIIEIGVPVSGTWVPAEPDVGINDGYFEDVQVECDGVHLHTGLNKTYADAIQEALADARQGEKEDAADARYDEARDKRGMDDA